MVKCKLVDEKKPVLKKFIDFRHFRANFLLITVHFLMTFVFRLLTDIFMWVRNRHNGNAIKSIRKSSRKQRGHFFYYFDEKEKSDFFRLTIKTSNFQSVKSLASLSIDTKISHADNPWLHSVCYWSEKWTQSTRESMKRKIKGFQIQGYQSRLKTV